MLSCCILMETDCFYYLSQGSKVKFLKFTAAACYKHGGKKSYWVWSKTVVTTSELSGCDKFAWALLGHAVMKEERDTKGSELGLHASSCGYDGKGYRPVPHHKVMVVHRIMLCKSCLGVWSSPWPSRRTLHPKPVQAFFRTVREQAGLQDKHMHTQTKLWGIQFMLMHVLGYHKA